jgi:hypothetical protein
LASQIDAVRRGTESIQEAKATGCMPELGSSVLELRRSFQTGDAAVQSACVALAGDAANVAIETCVADVAEHVRRAFDKKASDYSEAVTRAQCLAAKEAATVAVTIGATDAEVGKLLEGCAKVLTQIASEEQASKAGGDDIRH